MEQVAEDVEEEEDGEQVQEGEEALIVVERAGEEGEDRLPPDAPVVRDDLAGEEGDADYDQEEGVEAGARDEQALSENRQYWRMLSA